MTGSKVEKEIGGRTLSIETGRVARQANGAALVRYADTVVFCAVTVAKPRDDIDFFPLTVDYREKTSAAGKFPILPTRYPHPSMCDSQGRFRSLRTGTFRSTSSRSTP